MVNENCGAEFQVGDIIQLRGGRNGEQEFVHLRDGRELSVSTIPPPTRWDGYFPPGAGLPPGKQADRRKFLLDLWDALPGHEATGDTAGSIRAMLLFSEVGDEIRETRWKK